MSSLHDRLDTDYAPAWRPNPGDKVIGTVTALDVRDGTYGSYPIVTIDTGDGELALHCFHEVLANELAKIAPKIGDRVGVKYAGKRPERGYHIYRVQRDGDDTEFAWNRFGGEDTAPSSDPDGRVSVNDDVENSRDYGKPTAPLAGTGTPDDDTIPFAPSVI
jgi:hypothetical protein